MSKGMPDYLDNRRLTTFAEETALRRFAQEAAVFFEKTPQGSTYSNGEIDPALLAIRWGSMGQAVFVVKLEDHKNVIFGDCLTERSWSSDPDRGWAFVLAKDPTFTTRYNPATQRRLVCETVMRIVDSIGSVWGCLEVTGELASLLADVAIEKRASEATGETEEPQARPPHVREAYRTILFLAESRLLRSHFSHEEIGRLRDALKGVW